MCFNKFGITEEQYKNAKQVNTVDDSIKVGDVIECDAIYNARNIGVVDEVGTLYRYAILGNKMVCVELVKVPYIRVPIVEKKHKELLDSEYQYFVSDWASFDNKKNGDIGIRAIWIDYLYKNAFFDMKYFYCREKNDEYAKAKFIASIEGDIRDAKEKIALWEKAKGRLLL